MENEILENLRKAVHEFDNEGAATWARKAVEEDVDPIKALDALTQAIREVGDAFGAGECFLPELVGSADAMQSAMPIIEEELKVEGARRVSTGKVVVGTVAGDIHNIGKTILCTLLTADGFEVIDLGIDVTTEQFVKVVRNQKPDILAMSALLTITAAEQKNVIEALTKEGTRDNLKIMVGGGAISEKFAEGIGRMATTPQLPEV